MTAHGYPPSTYSYGPRRSTGSTYFQRGYATYSKVNNLKIQVRRTYSYGPRRSTGIAAHGLVTAAVFRVGSGLPRSMQSVSFFYGIFFEGTAECLFLVTCHSFPSFIPQPIISSRPFTYLAIPGSTPPTNPSTYGRTRPFGRDPVHIQFRVCCDE